MNIFEKSFFKKNDNLPEKELIKLKEDETSILKLCLEEEEKNWVEIEGSLHQLNSPLIAKMSDERKEELKDAIIKTKEVFVAEKDSIEKDSIESIKKHLDGITQQL